MRVIRAAGAFCALAILGVACSDDTTTPRPVRISMLSIGDSYTIGESVPAGKSWPEQLVATLVDESIIVDELTVVARTGWTTTDLLDTLTAEAPPPHDFVTLLVGANNVFGRLPNATFETEFPQLLALAISLADGQPEHVLVVSIPDYTVTPVGSRIEPDAMRTEIDGYNELILRATREQNVTMIDVTGISRLALEDPTLIARDGLHPSASQYALWVEAIRPVVVETFRRRSIFERED